MTFAEAARTFRTLEKRRRKGRLLGDRFLAEVDQLRVVWNDGTTWKPHPDGTGWLVWDGTTWRPAAPPVPDPLATTQATPTATSGSPEAPTKPPETLAELGQLLVRQLLHGMVWKLGLAAGIFVVTWGFHTFLLVYVNEGFWPGGSSGFWRSLLPAPFVGWLVAATNALLSMPGKSRLTATLFWTLAPALVTGALVRMRALGPGGWLRNLLETPSWISSELRTARTAPFARPVLWFSVAMGLAAAVILGAPPFYASRPLVLVLALHGISALAAHLGTFTVLVASITWSDLQRFFRANRPRLPLDSRYLLIVHVGLTAGLLAGVFLPFLAILGILGILAATAAGAVVLVQTLTGGRGPGGPGRGPTVAVLAFLVAAAVALPLLADDGGWQECGGTFGRWVHSEGAVRAVAQGVLPSAAAAAGALLGAAAATVAGALGWASAGIGTTGSVAGGLAGAEESGAGTGSVPPPVPPTPPLGPPVPEGPPAPSAAVPAGPPQPPPLPSQPPVQGPPVPPVPPPVPPKPPEKPAAPPEPEQPTPAPKQPSEPKQQPAAPAPKHKKTGFFAGLWRHAKGAAASLKELAGDTVQAAKDVYHDPSILTNTVRNIGKEVKETARDAAALGTRAAHAVKHMVTHPKETLQKVGSSLTTLKDDAVDAAKDIYNHPSILKDTIIGTGRDIGRGTVKAAKWVKDTATDPDRLVDAVKTITGLSDIEKSFDPNRSLSNRMGHAVLGWAQMIGLGQAAKGATTAKTAAAYGDDAARLAVKAGGFSDDAARAAGSFADDAAGAAGKISGLSDDAARAAAGSDDAARAAGLERTSGVRRAKPGPDDFIEAPDVPPDTGGYTRSSQKALQKVADEEDVQILTRPGNKHAPELLKKGEAIPKPIYIKNKTVNELDTMLGMSEDSLGKAAHFEPKLPPDEVLDGLPPEVKQKLLDRYEYREWEYTAQADHIVGEGGAIHVKDGVIYDNLTGKPFAGDVDVYGIRDAHGNPLPPEKVQRVLAKLKRAGANTRHGAHENWDMSGLSGEDLEIAKKIDSAIRQRHTRSGGEALVRFGPGKDAPGAVHLADHAAGVGG